MSTWSAWDGDEGEEWARDWQRYDRAVVGYHRLLLEAAAVGRSDRVVDVGCGNGETTRDAARAAADGSVLGIDLASQMIERARGLARADGLANVTFERVDAQAHPFARASFDAALSRFGTMFFAAAIAAFTNIGSALRPGGRLTMVAWRGLGDNEWLQSVFGALAVGRDRPVPPVGAPGPFLAHYRPHHRLINFGCGASTSDPTVASVHADDRGLGLSGRGDRGDPGARLRFRRFG